jgi:hypothetical protein
LERLRRELEFIGIRRKTFSRQQIESYKKITIQFTEINREVFITIETVRDSGFNYYFCLFNHLFTCHRNALIQVKLEEKK